MRFNKLPIFFIDSSTFGSKMLEKMGWKKGDGLGKNQSGNVDFIQIRYKNDEHGLGFNKFGMDDNWTQNEASFDELLKSLNSERGDQDDQNESSANKSLLEKSASSRARVHYKKRVQCKDVHKYSEKDLANILGKKTLKEEPSSSDAEKSERKAVKKEKCEENEKSSAYESSLIVKSQMSLQDYFKSKLESKKGKSEKHPFFNDEVEAEEVYSKPKESKKRKSKVVEDEVDIPVKSKSKNKKTEMIDEEIVKQEVKSKSKKKKQEIESVEVEDEEPAKLKSKKKPDKIKNEDSVAKVTSEEKVDSTQKGVNSIYGTNVIQIPSYMANKLANMSVDEFSNSNLSNIIGYGMTEDTTIKILQTKVSENTGSVDKYTLYNNDKLTTKRVNPRKILSSIKKIKKSIQVI